MAHSFLFIRVTTPHHLLAIKQILLLWYKPEATGTSTCPQLLHPAKFPKSVSLTSAYINFANHILEHTPTLTL